jgi:hypothetical protein
MNTITDKIGLARPAAATALECEFPLVEISQIGEEMKLLSPVLKDTRIVPEAAILYSHYNDWALQQPNQPNKHFSLREHIQRPGVLREYCNRDTDRRRETARLTWAADTTRQVARLCSHRSGRRSIRRWRAGRRE